MSVHTFSAFATLAVIVTQTSNAQDPGPKLVSQVKPCVVTVFAYDIGGRKISTGSGFFIARSRVVTNYHVLQNAASAKVRLPSGRSHDVHAVLASDTNADLMIISIKEHTNAFLEAARVEPEVGARIFVVGAPMGLESSISDGLVSGVRRLKTSSENGDPQTLLQISAPISPGSSGGPVVNLNGRYVGVVHSQIIQGRALSFAIPAQHVTRLEIAQPVAFEAWFRADQKRQLRRAYFQSDILSVLRHLPNVPTTDLDALQLHFIGKCLIATGDYDRAIAVLKLAHSQTAQSEDHPPVKEFFLGMYAETLRSAERLQAREAIVPREYRRTTCGWSNAKWHAQAGTGYLVKGEHRWALEAFRAAVQLEPSDASAWFGMALAFQGLGRVFEARDAYSRFAELEPATPKGHFMCGIFYASTGEFEKAQGFFDTFTRLRPSAAYGFAALGSASAARGDLLTAHSAYAKAIELGGSYRQDLIYVLLALGKTEEAKRQVELIPSDDLLKGGLARQVEEADTRVEGRLSAQWLFQQGWRPMLMLMSSPIELNLEASVLMNAFMADELRIRFRLP